MCDPRNKSALPRSGALGVRRKFCLARACVMADAGLSKIERKLGLKTNKIEFIRLNLNFLHEIYIVDLTFDDDWSSDPYRLATSPMNLVLRCAIVCPCWMCRRHETHLECRAFANGAILFGPEPFDSMLWRVVSQLLHGIWVDRLHLISAHWLTILVPKNQPWQICNTIIYWSDKWDRVSPLCHAATMSVGCRTVFNFH